MPILRNSCDDDDTDDSTYFMKVHQNNAFIIQKFNKILNTLISATACDTDSFEFR